jgi:hypothetical protein
MQSSCFATWSESIEILSKVRIKLDFNFVAHRGHARTVLNVQHEPSEWFEFLSWHPGHVNERAVWSSEFKGILDSFASFLFELLLLRVKLVAAGLGPLASKFDAAEELAFLGPHILDITKEGR